MEGVPQARAEEAVEQRDKLREQAAAQLEKLQSMDGREATATPAAEPQPAPETQPTAADAADRSVRSAVPQTRSPRCPRMPRTAAICRSTWTSRRSESPITLASFTAIHVSYSMPAMWIVTADWRPLLWAGLCLVIAVAFVRILRRPDAAALVARRWPWWAVVVGIIWLFLLPAGVFGLVVAMIAAWVLIARSRRQPAREAVRPENVVGSGKVAPSARQGVGRTERPSRFTYSGKNHPDDR